MRIFEKVTIIGVGLIGGSIGLALKKRRLSREVVGVFRRASTLKRALRCKAIDKGTLSVAEGVRQADVIVIATPVGLIPRMVLEAARHAKKGAVITDAGSTKAWIVRSVERHLRRGHASFVGSHPMAGSDHAGVEFARPNLLEGSPCIITTTEKTNRGALDKTARFWKSLGAKVSVMTPQAHDKSVSFISHLPHLAAFSLAGVVSVRDLAYAAEGFRDTTRVASSDAALWADIFMSNKREVLRSVRLFERNLKKITVALSKDDRAQIIGLLKKAKSVRDRVRK